MDGGHDERLGAYVLRGRECGRGGHIGRLRSRPVKAEFGFSNRKGREWVAMT